MVSILVTGVAGFIGAAVVSKLIKNTSHMGAAMFVEAIERHQGFNVACFEEIAWNNGWLSNEQVSLKAQLFSKNVYVQGFSDLLEGSYK